METQTETRPASAYVVLSVSELRALMRHARAESVKTYGRVVGQSCLVVHFPVCQNREHDSAKGEPQLASHTATLASGAPACSAPSRRSAKARNS